MHVIVYICARVCVHYISKCKYVRERGEREREKLNEMNMYVLVLLCVQYSSYLRLAVMKVNFVCHILFFSHIFVWGSGF